MRHVLVIGVLGSVMGVGAAEASPREALGFVRDAIDVVDESNPRCRRQMLDELLSVEGLLKDDAEVRAHRKIRDLRTSANRCPERVERLLRNAQDALEDDTGDRDDRRRDRDRDDRRDRRRDRDRDDRRDDRRAEPEPPKRPAGVPYADWNQDCRDVWFINAIARGNTNQSTLDDMNAVFGAACENASGVGGTVYYPNGGMAKSSAGAIYYPNGGMAKSGAGAFYYPNGGMARSGAGAWYYPNGGMAKSGSGTWYYTNGASAGSWQTIQSTGCAKSETACAAYKLALNSDIEDWRTLALVKLATAAR